MRGSSTQWSFSNIVSFKSAQERASATNRSYPPHFSQRATGLDKQGSSQYHWHQNDLPPINHHSDDRPYPASVYLPGNASNVAASGGSSANGPIVGSTDLRSSPSISTGPCQLTIFYNGSVCVYDHVSPEKAKAIMLLAGNGDSTKPSTPPIGLSSIPNVQPLLSKMPPTGPVILTQPPLLRPLPVDTSISDQAPALKKLPPNNTGITQHAQANDTINAHEPTSSVLVVKDTFVSSQAGRFSGSIASPAPITQSPVIASTSASEVVSVKPVVATAQPISSEPSKADASVGASSAKSAPSAVPQARKASLARFLEKRKERVVAVSPYPLSKNSSDCNTIGFRSTFPTNFVGSKKLLDTVESKT